MKKENINIPYEVLMECLDLLLAYKIEVEVTSVDCNMGITNLEIHYTNDNYQQENAIAAVEEIITDFNYLLGNDRYALNNLNNFIE